MPNPTLFQILYRKLPKECSIEDLTKYRAELEEAKKKEERKQERAQSRNMVLFGSTTHVSDTYALNVYATPLKEIDAEMKKRMEQTEGTLSSEFAVAEPETLKP